MRVYRLEVETEGREVYRIEAETEEAARELFERGESGAPDVSEVTGATIVHAEEET